MRVMVIVKANAESEAGQMPSEELLAADDFGKELTPELRAQEERTRAEVERQHHA